jgi:hypothetical protein
MRLAFTITAFLFGVAFLAEKSLGQEKATGLILATEQQLRGIPLADAPFSGDQLPQNVDLSNEMPPPGDQGHQNSCVAWTIAYGLKSFQERAEERWRIADPSGSIDKQHVFSPAFIYNQINGGRDGGSLFTDALNLLSDSGVAPLSEMPYDPNDFTSRPTAQARDIARKYCINTWRRVNIQDVKEVKAQLNAGLPVIIGATVDDGFMRLRRGDKWKSVQGVQRGGHAMLLVGYSDDKQAFRVMNSWGTAWSDGGFGWIDYEFARRVVSEGYVAKDAINGANPENPRPRPNPPAPPRDPTEIRPTPPVPRVLSQASLQVLNVQHNVRGQDGQWYMLVSGNLDAPAGSGQSLNVVVHFFEDAGFGRKGRPIVGTAQQNADVAGYAATGCPALDIPTEGIRSGWSCWIPYSAFSLNVGWIRTPQGVFYQRGQASLLAEATLFIDNFGVQSSGSLPFNVVYP